MQSTQPTTHANKRLKVLPGVCGDLSKALKLPGPAQVWENRPHETGVGAWPQCTEFCSIGADSGRLKRGVRGSRSVQLTPGCKEWLNTIALGYADLFKALKLRGIAAVGRKGTERRKIYKNVGSIAKHAVGGAVTSATIPLAPTDLFQG